jgi:hypothetical protein
MKKESLTLPETNPGKAKFLAETQRINLNAEPTGRAALVAPQLIDLRGAFHALQIEASPVNSRSDSVLLRKLQTHRRKFGNGDTLGCWSFKHFLSTVGG